MQGAVNKVAEPKNVFLALHHHFLCLADAGLRLAGAEDGQQSMSEQTVLSAAVSRDPEGERELCARAMAALYHAHAAAIGAAIQGSSDAHTQLHFPPYCQFPLPLPFPCLDAPLPHLEH